MFESLKKKFSKTNDELTEKLKEEAEEENNLEETDEKEETINTEATDFFSRVKRESEKRDRENDSNKKENENTDSKVKEEEKTKKDKEKSPESEVKKEEKPEEDKEKSPESEVKEEEKPEEDKDEKKESKGFFSKFKRDSKDKKEESEEVEDDKSKEKKEDEETSNEKDKEEDEKESEGFRSRFKIGSDDKDKDSDDKDEAESSGGIFSFIKEKTLSEDDVDDILFDLEMSLLEGDVAMDVADKVVNDVKDNLVGKKIKRSSDIEEYIYESLKNAVSDIINIEGKSMTEMIEDKKKEGEPLVVMFVGINGTGKTTTIGKLANYYLKKGYTPVIAASDTFRAGAIEQVKYHADKVGVKLIKHEKGSDPAAVAFDAVSHAKAQGKELVLIDTAGRMQNNVNLMDEMKKIRRVAKPDLVIFVGDALTGNDATEQASKFNDSIDIDGIILTKADADSKGGASLSIGYVIQKPILFLGMGQEYDDIIEYDPDWMLNQLFS